MTDPPPTTPPPPGDHPRPDSGPSMWRKALPGFVMGLTLSLLSPLVWFILIVGFFMDSDISAARVLPLVTVITALFGVPMLFRKGARTRGVGVVLGLAVGSLVLGGACVSYLGIQA